MSVIHQIYLMKKVFYHDGFSFSNIHSRRAGDFLTGQQEKGETISLTFFCHVHPIHGHLDISWEITAESSPSHKASNQTETGTLGFRVKAANR